MKKRHLLFLVTLTAIFLTACSSTAPPSPIDQPSCQKGLKPSITQLNEKNKNQKFRFALKNVSDHDITVVFPSSREYQYTLTDGAGQMQKGADHSFSSKLRKKRIIKDGKTLEYTIRLDKLKSGSYVLETQFLGTGCETLTASYDFETE